MSTLNLTKKQVRAYLEAEQSRAGDRFAPAGIAADHESCPLVRAYRYTHPHVRDIAIVNYGAYINGMHYKLRIWHIKFIQDVDSIARAAPNRFEAGTVTHVSIDYCLGLLDGGEV